MKELKRECLWKKKVSLPSMKQQSALLTTLNIFLNYIFMGIFLVWCLRWMLKLEDSCNNLFFLHFFLFSLSIITFYLLSLLSDHSICSHIVINGYSFIPTHFQQVFGVPRVLTIVNLPLLNFFLPFILISKIFYSFFWHLKT